jgi:hypothetical protein
MRRVLGPLMACVLAGQDPQSGWKLDGQISADERAGASVVKMSRGGTASLRRAGDLLYVAVESPAGGFANVCVGSDTRVRVLHASAALGDAEFEARGGTWARLTTFEWVLRDSSRVPPPTDAQKQAHLDTRGWLATAKNEPTLVREFLVRLKPGERHAAVTFVETGDGIAVSAGPASVDDGCASGPVAQGNLPDSTSFRPAAWFSLDSLRR